MSQNITFNGSSYTIPDVGDTDWGQNVTDYLVAIPSGALQPTGGLFSLSADVDFGANFGLESIYYKSRTANIAATGVMRLARVDSVTWRNAANSADLPLSVNALDQLTFNGIVIESDTLASANIFVGNGAGESTGVPMTGDLGIDNAGLTAIQSGVIVDGDINGSAAIALTKLAAMTASQMVVSDVSGFLVPSGWGFLSNNLITASEAELRFQDGTTNYISFKAPNAVTTYDLTLPDAQGAVGEVMFNDGAGVLTWGVTSGMGTVNSGIAGRFSYYAANGTVLSDQTALTTDGSSWVRFADGTSGAAGISFISDPDDGFFHDTANQIAVSIAGTKTSVFRFTGLMVPDGTLSDPAVSFNDDPTGNGIYRTGSNAWSLAAGSVRVFSVNSGGLTSRVAHAFSVGTALLPSISFIGDPNSGLYWLATDQVGFSANGAFAGGFGLSGGVNGFFGTDGTAARPAYSFNSAGGTGLWTDGADNLNFSEAGVQTAFLNQSGLGLLMSGSVGSPALRFTDSDNGLYYINTDQWGLSAGGALKIEIGSTNISMYQGGSLVQQVVAAQTRFVSGSASAPGIAHIGDTDTGIFFGTNTVQITSGGTRSAFFSSTTAQIGPDATNAQCAFSTAGMYPIVTNVIPCGKSGNLWTDVWATSGSVNTSHSTTKYDIKPLEDLPLPKAVRFKRIDDAEFRKGKEYIGYLNDNLPDAARAISEDGTLDKKGNYSNAVVGILIAHVSKLEKKIKQLEEAH